MANFKTRIKTLTKEKGRIILANDYETSPSKLEAQTIKNIRTLNNYLCGIKFNFHLLLPLGFKEITKINRLAHKNDLQCIADIKLNDIGNTNRITLETLWKLGFDAVIVNPIMGKTSLKKLIDLAHSKNMGIITLGHMSSPDAKLSYEMKIKVENNKKHSKLYELFLSWSLSHKADGIIIGATFPNIIKNCKNKINGRMNIYSPGIGTQGGDVKKAISSGTDFLIVGRTILNSKNPSRKAKQLHLQTLS